MTLEVCQNSVWDAADYTLLDSMGACMLVRRIKRVCSHEASRALRGFMRSKSGRYASCETVIQYRYRCYENTDVYYSGKIHHGGWRTSGPLPVAHVPARYQYIL